MSTGISTELQHFTLFLQAKLQAGESRLSPEEALELWREEHPTEEDFEEEVQAIKIALDRMHAGERGMPAEEFCQKLLERAQRPVQ